MCKKLIHRLHVTLLSNVGSICYMISAKNILLHITLIFSRIVSYMDGYAVQDIPVLYYSFLKQIVKTSTSLFTPCSLVIQVVEALLHS